MPFIRRHNAPLKTTALSPIFMVSTTTGFHYIYFNTMLFSRRAVLTALMFLQGESFADNWVGRGFFSRDDLSRHTKCIIFVVKTQPRLLSLARLKVIMDSVPTRSTRRSSYRSKLGATTAPVSPAFSMWNVVSVRILVALGIH